jgi:hypothetical protein
MPLYYGREDSLNFLRESLCTPDFVLEPSSEEGRMPLFIPSLVHIVMDKSVQYVFSVRKLVDCLIPVVLHGSAIFWDTNMPMC